ncbi:hypothetical protein FRC19_000773 [Serendipita sp. 401]|nr:hypothetical protein FRC19_000773 [Serendipita sp. 401]
MSTARRQQQAPRLARPAQRHFAKKAPRNARDVDDESTDEEQEHQQQQFQDQQQQQEDESVAVGEYGEGEEEEGMVLAGKKAGKEKAKAKGVRVALGNVQIKDGRVLVNGLEESGRTLVEQQMAQESSESESESEEEESSEEESSEEEEPAKPQLRPVFVSKTARATLKERDAAAFDSEETIKKREAAAEERKRQSRNMVGDSIKRGLEEREAKPPGAEIDDTDGLQPEEEFDAWRLRELHRLKREKEAERVREEERLEIERRKAMPEEQRMKEDLERAQKLRDDKPKNTGSFLQKYWHKGAFFQDLDELKNRDYSGRPESQVDMTLLPKVMQVKDFGKRSRTKYTYLRDQDTTRAAKPTGAASTGGAGSGMAPPDGQGCFLCGGPHLKRDCPQNDPSKAPPGGQRTGSNKTDGFSNSRKWGETAGGGSSEKTREDSSKSSRHDWRDRSPPPGRRRSQSPPPPRHYDDRDRRDRDRDRDRDGDRDRYRDNRDRDRSDRKEYSSRKHSRSPHARRRSRSPRPSSHSNRHHSRSRSPAYKDDDRGPKRRRVDV